LKWRLATHRLGVAVLCGTKVDIGDGPYPDKRNCRSPRGSTNRHDLRFVSPRFATVAAFAV